MDSQNLEVSLSQRLPNCLGTFHARSDVEREVSRFLRPHRMDIDATRPMRAELYNVALHDASLSEIYYGTETRIDAGHIDDHYLFRVTLSGHAELDTERQRVDLTTGSISVSSPEHRIRLASSSDCRSLLLRLNRQLLETRLSDMLGDRVVRPLAFDVSFDAGSPPAQMIRETIVYLRQLCSVAPAAPSRALGKDLTQWLATMMLDQVPHNYSAALATESTGPLPHHVRRARDYIDAHLGEALNVDVLARVTGVSPRTLQNGFNHFLGTSPGNYVRDRRMAAVHQALTAMPERSVTDILIEHGVHSFGHFAKAYRERYGELPSATSRGTARH
ncbi:AraC family transcriptional regulator [Robbsia sp. KACC 23696]|uniref:AraC family transcriptional regulator n=1 Tax=Robbsia sp. KACC 23696 TaxID=3149231 RepID=UPI00325A69A6